MNIKNLLEEIKYNKGHYPKDEIDQLIENKDQAIAELINIIAYTEENIYDLIEKDNYFIHIYAIYLLAQLKEQSAYQVIIDFFSIPGEISLDITGDLVTKNLGRILASVYDGNDKPLKKLLEDHSVNEYIRSAILECFITLVATDIKPRSEVISYFKELFNGKLEPEHSYVPTALVTQSSRIYPEELIDEIKQAFNDEKVELFFINYQDIKNILGDGKELTLKHLKNDPEYTLITDIHEELSTYHGFKQEKKIVIKQEKIGRNSPCPCGSGKKYKKCCYT